MTLENKQEVDSNKQEVDSNTQEASSRWSSKVFDGQSRDSALVPKNAKETPGNLEGCEADERPRPDRDLDPPLELYCW